MSENLFVLLFSFLWCIPPVAERPTEEVHPAFPYNLEQPNAIFEMPESLKEISGLGLTNDELIAVNDEEGILFFIDKVKGKITREVSFWGDGDYEGIEVVGNDAFVVKSNGTIYHVENYLTDKPTTSKIKSFLNKENDIEGLTYDPVKNCLLLGCKGKISEDSDQQAAFKKAIYEYHLEEMVMKSQPAFLLTLPDIQDYISHMEEHGNIDKLKEIFSEEKDELKFSPSGIAIHPITKNIYVTSSKGKLLLVLNQSGDILHIQKLKKKIHRQPEGICFDSDGTLYIANEGKEDKAVVYKFLYNH